MAEYNEDYFERGLQKGLSTYENYSWIPDLTIPMVYEMIRYLDLQRCHEILDFGCAKGFYVKAFRLLHFNAYGIDISKYAIDNAPDDVKRFLRHWDKERGYKNEKPLNEFLRDMYLPLDWVIAKDVFEHIEIIDLARILKELSMVAQNMFVIVPLGSATNYYSPLNNLDPTHVICQGYNWWIKFFNDTPWQVVKSTTHISYMKQLHNDIDDAHGFYTLKLR